MILSSTIVMGDIYYRTALVINNLLDPNLCDTCVHVCTCGGYYLDCYYLVSLSAKECHLWVFLYQGSQGVCVCVCVRVRVHA